MSGITLARVEPLKNHQPAACPPSAFHTKQIASNANVGSSGVFLLFDCNQQSSLRWSGIAAAFHLSRLVRLWKWIKPGWRSGRDWGDTVAHSVWPVCSVWLISYEQTVSNQYQIMILVMLDCIEFWMLGAQYSRQCKDEAE